VSHHISKKGSIAKKPGSVFKRTRLAFMHCRYYGLHEIQLPTSALCNPLGIRLPEHPAFTPAGNGHNESPAFRAGVHLTTILYESYYTMLSIHYIHSAFISGTLKRVISHSCIISFECNLYPLSIYLLPTLRSCIQR